MMIDMLVHQLSPTLAVHLAEDGMLCEHMIVRRIVQSMELVDEHVTLAGEFLRFAESHPGVQLGRGR